MEIPPPPRSDDGFKVFYKHERGNMIVLAAAQGGRLLNDPEGTAQKGWQRFYPHWATCDNPFGYLRSCVLSAVRDELRALGADPPVIVPLDEFSEGLVQVRADRGRGVPAPLQPATARESWRSWDPLLAAALASLSGKLREAVLLDAELNPGERKVAAIAEILGISRVTAHMRLKRAYAQLRQLLPDGYLEERRERLRDHPGGLEERSAP